MKRLLAMLGVACLLIFPAGLAEENGSADHWICLECGSKTGGDFCGVCGKPAGAWICSACKAENLGSSCHSCGMTREASLDTQAASGDLLTAWPAVRYLAGQSRPDALVALAERFRDGAFLPAPCCRHGLCACLGTAGPHV